MVQRIKLSIKVLLLSSVAGLLLTACGSEPVQEGNTLDGTSWELVSFNRNKPLGHRPITLKFQSGFKVSGNAGCNRYSGLISLKGSNRINMDLSQKEFDEDKNRILTTKMYCPSPSGLMDQEQSYLEQLANSRHYSIVGDTLKIKDGADALVYKRVGN